MKNIYKELISEYERKEESKLIKEMNDIPVIFIIFENNIYDSGTILKYSSDKYDNIYSLFELPKHIKCQFYLSNTEGTTLLIEENKKVIEIYEMFKDPEDELLYIFVILENNFEFNIKKTTSESERKDMYKNIELNSPNKIPIILEKNPDCIFTKQIQSKFLVDNELSFKQFENFIKKKINEINIFYEIKFYIRGLILLDNNSFISVIYENFKDEKDGFLYISYDIEINKIPIVIQVKPENDIFKIYRILVNKDIYFSNLKKIIKERNKLDEDLKLNFSIKSNQIDNDNVLLFDLYKQHKDSDEILKIDYSNIN